MSATVALRDVCAFITKGATPTTYGLAWQKAGVPFLRSECVSDEGLDMRQAMYISPQADVVLKRSQVIDGDILMTITGNVGRVVRLSGLGRANINQHIARIRVKDARVDPQFVYHYLSQPRIREYYESIVTGQAYPQISLVQVRETRVPLLALSEQRRIALALSDADAVVSSVERLITKKQAIKQGMVQELLTGRTRLPGFAGRWQDTRLGDGGACIRGVSYDPGSDLSPGDRAYTVRLLRSNNVQSRGMEFSELQFVHERRVKPIEILRPNDIVICMANGSRSLVGKAALFAQSTTKLRYTVGAFMGVFRCDSSAIVPGFAIEVLGSEDFRRWLDLILSGSSINNLRPGDVESFVTPMPAMGEQVAIAEVLGDANREIDLLRQRLDKARDIKQGMMQELLTGRTRLPLQEAVA